MSGNGPTGEMRPSAPEGRTAAEDLILRAEKAIADEEMVVALKLLDAAEAAGAEPDRCAGNRWMTHMLRGDLPAAWCESDAIRRRGAPDPHRFWMGEDLRGKRVILRSLHGFGDAVQMFRFLPRLQAMAAHLIVEVPPRLVELAPFFDGVTEVITWGEGAPAQSPLWDVQLEVMELPYLLRVSTGELAPKHGYLRLPAALRVEVAASMEAKRAASMKAERVPRVGVVWTAGHWNPSRSIAPELLAGLARVEGVEFWSLEHRHGSAANSSFPAQPTDSWRDAAEVGDGILRLAATVEQLDLVITVDTLAAHLAGALGVPCWLLLQHRADWRWMSGRTDSPWYPTLQLYRQRAPGDWAGLLATVAADLKVWAEAWAPAGKAAEPVNC